MVPYSRREMTRCESSDDDESISAWMTQVVENANRIMPRTFESVEFVYNFLQPRSGKYRFMVYGRTRRVEKRKRGNCNNAPFIPWNSYIVSQMWEFCYITLFGKIHSIISSPRLLRTPLCI